VDLLKGHHLLEEAQALLVKVERPQPGAGEGKLKVHSREPAWLSRGWPGLHETRYLWPLGEEEQKSLSGSWLAGRLARGSALPADGTATPGEALLAWFLPQPARAAWWEGQEPALDWGHPRPFPPAGYFQTDLAGRFRPEITFSRATQGYQALRIDAAPQELTPFHQDRQGLSRFKGGQPDAAQAAFHGLAQHSDPFWQRLGQVRLADLELFRLQAEPSP